MLGHGGILRLSVSNWSTRVTSIALSSSNPDIETTVFDGNYSESIRSTTGQADEMTIGFQLDENGLPPFFYKPPTVEQISITWPDQMFVCAGFGMKFDFDYADDGALAEGTVTFKLTGRELWFALNPVINDDNNDVYNDDGILVFAG